MLGLILEHHPHGPLANLCWVLASSCHRPILSQDLEPPTFPGRFNSSPFAVGKSDSTKRRHSIGRRWGHFRSSFGPHVGPVQSVIPKLEVEAGGGFVDAFQQVSLGCRSAPPIWQLRNIHRNSMGREGWQTLRPLRLLESSGPGEPVRAPVPPLLPGLGSTSRQTSDRSPRQQRRGAESILLRNRCQ